MKQRNSKLQMSESYFVGALLAVIGGYLDAYTYISRGGVFANAQTGNIVLLGINLSAGNFSKALSYLAPIAAFIVGVFVSEFVRKVGNSKHIHWRQYIIFLEFLIVIAVSFLPTNNSNSYIFDMVANVSISFVCSLQVQSFRKINGITCATTMCTGNLRSATECIIHYRSAKDKNMLLNSLKYYGIVFFFIVGAAISSFVTKALNQKSIIFCAVGLLVILALMFIKSEEITEK